MFEEHRQFRCRIVEFGNGSDSVEEGKGADGVTSSRQLQKCFLRVFSTFSNKLANLVQKRVEKRMVDSNVPPCVTTYLRSFCS